MYLSKDEMHRQRLPVCNRRRFLRAGGGAVALLLSPALVQATSHPQRILNFHNTHTGESATAVYWADGEYLADGREEINVILRDHRTDEIHPIVPGLLDLLYVLQGQVKNRQVYEVISGYRSPATNAALRRRGSGVAKHSYHMQGKAIDIRLRGCDLKMLHKAALDLQAGGVGYYPDSEFIHVDVGPCRCW